MKKYRATTLTGSRQRGKVATTRINALQGNHHRAHTVITITNAAGVNKSEKGESFARRTPLHTAL